MCVCVGGGGGGREGGKRISRTGTKLINVVGMIHHASCAEDTRAECQTYGLIEIGKTLNKSR